MNSWEKWLEKVINPFLESESGKRLKNRVAAARDQRTVYPNSEDLFNAFYFTPIDNIKIVIIGNEPYASSNHADGLAFSSKQVTAPPELKMIYHELKNNLYAHITEDTWKQFYPTNSLVNWAKRGILPINRHYTVNKDEPKSHHEFGWNMFTRDYVLKFLNDYDKPLVFLFLGTETTDLKESITNDKHLVIDGGAGYFLKAIRFLQENRPEDCQEIELNIMKYFNENLFEDFLKEMKKNSYPFIFKDNSSLIEAMKNALKINYNYGIDLTLTNN